MKRIAVISSDKLLERVVVLALEYSAAARRQGVLPLPAGAGLHDGTAGCGGRVEVVPLPAGSALCGDEVAGCDAVVVVGAAGFVSGRFPAAAMRRRGGPEIYVVSWQHSEQTVLGLIECGVDQYMTLPLGLRRLCVKLLGQRKF